MSDPMTNVEIEDVLSSIRRLVAEGGQDTAPRAVVVPRAPKLVLTPALRVDTPDMDGADKTSVDPADHVSADAVAAPVILGPRHRIERPATAADKSAPDSDLSESVKVQDRVSLLATIAELEAAVREQPDEWEPDGTGTQTEPGWARAGFRDQTEISDAEELKEENLAPAPADAAAWPATLVEAARRYGDAGDDTVPEFRHHRAENVIRTEDGGDGFEDDLIGGPGLGADPEDPLDQYLNGTGLIDEAALRDMVRQIVRDELQGKLGERITHNVRKLVRREIHRVLTTQDFD
ncbi:hypothetical protein [Loktanella sp. M215]|uniref:hypothetical protein n=1 Tax=Loktanella sp. M215 TaxID=2675431 RepID=UPI001F2AF985|nr:hypothetical protein [Loktanella sp. M215]MCF7701220.1 hypothetical protein [Loktanella sp. M215]